MVCDGWREMAESFASQSCPASSRAARIASTEDAEKQRAMRSRCPASSEAAGSALKRSMARSTSASASSLPRSEEHTSELQSLMRHSYAVFCLKKKKEHLSKISSIQMTTD